MRLPIKTKRKNRVSKIVIVHTEQNVRDLNMKQNKFNIGEKVRVITTIGIPVKIGKVTMIYWDEEYATNFYSLDSFWLPLAEKELKKCGR